jgi:hypothetical protein
VLEAGIKRPRRYYLHKRKMVPMLDPEGVGAVDAFWKYKQEAEPGLPLPAEFPYRERLAVAFYTTVEDIDGADTDELQKARFTRLEAQLIIVEAEKLMLPPSQPIPVRMLP